MGTLERRKREKEHRRQAITAAAEHVFFSKGYEKATMDEVAAKAELSKGTLYLYFSSKEEVYLSIIVRAMKTLKRLFQEAVDSESEGINKVKAIGLAYIKFNTDYRNYYESLLYYSSLRIDLEKSSSSDMITFMHNIEIMNIFVGAIRNGIRDGSIRSDIHPEKTAITLWGQTSGILQLINLKGSAIKDTFEYTQAELIDYYMNFVYHSLKP